MSKLLLLCLLSMILSSCATSYEKFGATPYQKYDDQLGGYTDLIIQDNIFKVTFEGNGFSNRDEVANFALLRAAEVAMENGYNYFVITEGGVRMDSMTVSTGGFSEALSQIGMALQQTGIGVSGIEGTMSSLEMTQAQQGLQNLQQGRQTHIQTHLISWPIASYKIACFVYTPKDIDSKVYDARQVSVRL